MEELSVKAGDKVIRQARWGSDICEVVKVTPKGYIDIKLDGVTERFSKYGEIERIKQEIEFERKRSYLRNYSYQKLPLEALRELVGVIEKYEEK